MNRISLELVAGVWMAEYFGPHRAGVVELFETDTIPTPFGADADRDAMLRTIRGRNPGVDVYIAPARDIPSLVYVG